MKYIHLRSYLNQIALTWKQPIQKKKVSHIEGVMSINVVVLQTGYSCAPLKDWYFMLV